MKRVTYFASAAILLVAVDDVLAAAAALPARKSASRPACRAATPESN